MKQIHQKRSAILNTIKLRIHAKEVLYTAEKAAYFQLSVSRAMAVRVAMQGK